MQKMAKKIDFKKKKNLQDLQTSKGFVLY